MNNILLTCPIRGELTATALASDGLTPTEEAMRIDLLEFLIDKRGYPKSRIDVETVVLKNIGNAGRNSLRADVIVYDVDKSSARAMTPEDRLSHALLIAEVKRDGKHKKSAISHQLVPALILAPSMQTLGIYWDDEDRILYRKVLAGNKIDVEESTVAKLPKWGLSMTGNPITYEQLSSPKNLFKTLTGLADIMRSGGVEDKRLRYVETVKLLLARYTDEKTASDPGHPGDGILDLQIMPDGDPNFRQRVDEVYKRSAARYSKAKTLFTKKNRPLPMRLSNSLYKRFKGFDSQTPKRKRSNKSL
ncbi:MAG: type I restriction enzyme HsdR N-terminal domain-containing protein [Actinomycetaceae bacterium]|nr:type I restriction enzyme HsdR N-terminal domain-containing protein [Actinomycetaceae bacterium]